MVETSYDYSTLASLTHNLNMGGDSEEVFILGYKM